MRILPIVMLLGLGACSSVSTSTGIRIGDETLKHFKAGKTTENWILAILGEPSTTSPVEGEEDVKVLRYSLIQERSGGFISIFGKSEETVSTVYFVVRKGVVEAFWADRAEAPGLFGGGDESGEKKD